MKSDVIVIDNQGRGFSSAVAESRKVADYQGLNNQQSLHLQLITEEMLSMVRSVTGEVKASFWIENTGRRFRLNMTTEAVLDKEKRAELISASFSRKNAAANSFLGKLRDAFEQAMASETDHEYYELPKDLATDLAGRDIEQQDYDRYEVSVLRKLADDVRIGIVGKVVSMTVVKDFAD